MSTVACVLRTGGIYTPEWVRKLALGVQTWTSPTPRIVCLTDMDTRALEMAAPGVEAVGLKQDWPGWWSKLELFRVFTGPVLYLDLDTLVVGPLDELVAYDGPLAMLRDFYHPTRPASGVLAWHGDYTHLYERLVKTGPGPERRRMDHWMENEVEPVFLQDEFPDQIVSLKAHARKAAPEGARLVCGHGRPRLSDQAAGWACRRWRAL